MEVEILNQTGQGADTFQLSDKVFARDYNQALVHQVLTAYKANCRSGTRAQKTRGEVNRSTAKPYRQKGTGRARAGMRSSPIWRGGGRAFANRADENFSHKVNKKMYRSALSSILSKLLSEGRMLIIDKLDFDNIKTKNMVNTLKSLSLENKTVLFLLNEISDNLYFSARNLKEILLLNIEEVTHYSLVYFDKVVLTKDALVKLQESLL